MTAITFAVAGDVQLGDSAICPGFGVASRYGARGAHALFERTREALAADVCIVNLETVLSHDGLRPRHWRSMQMRGHREYADALARSGVTAVNLANNHAFQHGPGAFHDTTSALEEAGVAVCGIAGTTPWTSRPERIDVRGRSVGLLGYSMRPRQFCEEPPPYAEGTRSGMVSDVRRLARDHEHVVVALHWGEEFVERPSVEEVSLGHALVDAGATLVAGHHPHVLRPVEARDGRVIAYSLGNLVSDMIWYEPLRIGGILRGRFRLEDGDRVTDLNLVRTRIRDDFVPEIAGEVQPPAVREVEPLDARAYERAIADSIARQRRAAYRYALANLHRYPPRLLWQLGRRTLYNKLSAAPRRGG